ncbi:MAG: hypothetical protein PVG79_06325 [Gemmatimonadales bacterium]|jgi:uncharacterized coiled-coil DUF342 family protein
MGEQRDAYVNKIKNRLDEWNARIDRLEEQAQDTKAEAEELVQERIGRLRAKRDELEAKFREVQAAGADAWEIVKDGVEKAEGELRAAFDDAKSRVAGGDAGKDRG